MRRKARASRLMENVRNSAAISTRPTPRLILRLDSFQPQKAQQIKTGQREKHHPGGQKHFARNPIGLQDLIGGA